MKPLRLSKSSLAMTLSLLAGFDEPDVQAEQYSTEPEIAADMLWFAYLNNHLVGKKVADLGCGTGILALGAALLGANVVAVEKDAAVLEVAKKNAQQLSLQNIAFLQQDISTFSGTADTVVQNPPFGTKQKHADVRFLNKACEVAPVVYSLHKTATVAYLKQYAKRRNLDCIVVNQYRFPLKATQPFHKKSIKRIEVSALRMTSSKQPKAL